jgi:hypothetical protein
MATSGISCNLAPQHRTHHDNTTWPSAAGLFSFGREMNYHLQNLLWGLSAPFGTRRTGNLVSDIIHSAGSQLKPQEYEPLECSFRVFRRMLDRERVRTMFIVRAQVFRKLEDLMIEIYRCYQQSRDETSLLFYRDAKLNPVSLIGRGKGYDFIHIVHHDLRRPYRLSRSLP